MAERIIRAAEVLGDPRRVLAGTDCGFDTSAGRGRVAPDVVWAKLRSLAEGHASPRPGCSRAEPGMCWLCEARRGFQAELPDPPEAPPPKDQPVAAAPVATPGPEPDPA
ncbi:hypothetical protein ACFQU2_07290 [Siccirubricoccus deserti]